MYELEFEKLKLILQLVYEKRREIDSHFKVYYNDYYCYTKILIADSGNLMMVLKYSPVCSNQNPWSVYSRNYSFGDENYSSSTEIHYDLFIQKLIYDKFDGVRNSFNLHMDELLIGMV